MGKQELRRGGREESVLGREEMVWEDSEARKGTWKSYKSARLRGRDLGREGPKALSVRLARPHPASPVGQVGWQCLQDSCPR